MTNLEKFQLSSEEQILLKGGFGEETVTGGENTGTNTNTNETGRLASNTGGFAVSGRSSN